MKMTAYWDIAPCSLVEVDRRFRGAYSLYHQDDRAPPHDSNVYIIGGIKLQIPKVEWHDVYTKLMKSVTFLKVIREVQMDGHAGTIIP
jgi:hypothetical protein